MLHVTCSELPGDPTMHTGAHTQDSRLLCSRVYSGDVSTQNRNIRLCLWAGRPAISQAPDRERPHLTLTSVRKYVYTPHQRRGVVVVVNEKALV